MTQLTVFLARFIGLFTLLTVAGLLVRGGAIIESSVADGPVMFTLAIISLGGGAAVVVGHNHWSGGALPVVVTLIGWLSLAKGLLLLFLPPETLIRLYERSQYSEHLYLYIAPALCIGVFLTWCGFTAPTRGQS